MDKMQHNSLRIDKLPYGGYVLFSVDKGKIIYAHQSLNGIVDMMVELMEFDQNRLECPTKKAFLTEKQPF